MEVVTNNYFEENAINQNDFINIDIDDNQIEEVTKFKFEDFNFALYNCYESK